MKISDKLIDKILAFNLKEMSGEMQLSEIPTKESPSHDKLIFNLEQLDVDLESHGLFRKVEPRLIDDDEELLRQAPTTLPSIHLTGTE